MQSESPEAKSAYAQLLGEHLKESALYPHEAPTLSIINEQNLKANSFVVAEAGM